jgi:hypothetical protein
VCSGILRRGGRGVVEVKTNVPGHGRISVKPLPLYS